HHLRSKRIDSGAGIAALQGRDPLFERPHRLLRSAAGGSGEQAGNPEEVDRRDSQQRTNETAANGADPPAGRADPRRVGRRRRPRRLRPRGKVDGGRRLATPPPPISLSGTRLIAHRLAGLVSPPGPNIHGTGGARTRAAQPAAGISDRSASPSTRGATRMARPGTPRSGSPASSEMTKAVIPASAASSWARLTAARNAFAVRRE